MTVLSVHVTFVLTFAPSQCHRRLQWSQLFPYKGMSYWLEAQTLLKGLHFIVAAGCEAGSRPCVFW